MEEHNYYILHLFPIHLKSLLGSLYILLMTLSLDLVENGMWESNTFCFIYSI